MLSRDGDINQPNLYTPKHNALSSSRIRLSRLINSSTTHYKNKYQDKDNCKHSKTNDHQISTIQLNRGHRLHNYNKEDTVIFEDINCDTNISIITYYP